MSKVEQFTNEGYARPDPDRPGYSIFKVEVSVFNPLVEAGFVDKVSEMKNWDGEGSPCKGIEDWFKSEIKNCGQIIYLSQGLKTEEERLRLEFSSMS